MPRSVVTSRLLLPYRSPEAVHAEVAPEAWRGFMSTGIDGESAIPPSLLGQCLMSDLMPLGIFCKDFRGLPFGIAHGIIQKDVQVELDG